MILARIIKLKKWCKLRHLVVNGRTLCGLKPLKIHEIKGPIPWDGQTCANCSGINMGLPEPYPREPYRA